MSTDHQAAAAPSGAAGPGAVQELREIPLRGMRGMIATKMRESLQSTAQLTHHASAELGAVQALRAHCRTAGLAPPSVQDVLLRLVVQTLQDVPALNATLEDNRITEHPAVHLGLAVPLPDDLLLAPALFDAQAIALGTLPGA